MSYKNSCIKKDINAKIKIKRRKQMKGKLIIGRCVAIFMCFLFIAADVEQEVKKPAARAFMATDFSEMLQEKSNEK